MNAFRSILLALALTLPLGIFAQQEGETALEKIQVTMISQSKFGLPHNYMVSYPGMDAQMGHKLKDLESNPLIANVNPMPDHDYLIVVAHYDSAEMLRKKIDNFIQEEQRKPSRGI